MRYSIFVVFFVGSVFLTGCGFTIKRIDEPAAEQASMASDESSMVIDQTSKKMQKRFDPTIQEVDDSVQKSVELARLYEELSVKTDALRQTNNELMLENNQLKQKIETLKEELEQTKNDLTEANDFLGQMHLELNKWKSDVLGFRQEIRQAQQAQLEALGKILRVLGAESVQMPDTPEEDSSSDSGGI